MIPTPAAACHRGPGKRTSDSPGAGVATRSGPGDPRGRSARRSGRPAAASPTPLGDVLDFTADDPTNAPGLAGERRPVVIADGATTDEGTAVPVDVRANDIDADPRTVTGVTQGSQGGVAIHVGEPVTDTPVADVHGGDRFTDTIADGNGGTANVTITITPVNDAPVAADDPASTTEGAARTRTRPI